MSQRDSGYERKERDLYETPAWVTEAVIPHLPFVGDVDVNRLRRQLRLIEQAKCRTGPLKRLKGGFTHAWFIITTIRSQRL